MTGRTHFNYKVVLLGESAVGKSSLALRYAKGQFFDYQDSTTGGMHDYYYNFDPTNKHAKQIIPSEHQTEGGRDYGRSMIRWQLSSQRQRL